jgi:hypothetical protein
MALTCIHRTFAKAASMASSKAPRSTILTISNTQQSRAEYSIYNCYCAAGAPLFAQQLALVIIVPPRCA